ncbi:MAG: anaerobic ribonucleoside-triphosphate reductase activating protein [Patescibacteria group bacterium]
MLIGGLQKTSLIDYPGKIAAVVFTARCNFKCGFCHNPELSGEKDQLTKDFFLEKEILDFLEKRKKVLDGAVITGGEPTLHKDLPEFIRKIKNFGLAVKLDTNGTNPKMVEKLIKEKMVDFIAMDIKAPLRLYAKVTNSKLGTDNIKKSIKLIMNSGIDYEFRSTLLPALHTREDVAAMARLIKGAKKYALQKFFSSGGKLLDESFADKRGFTDKEMKELAVVCEGLVEKVVVR